MANEISELNNQTEIENNQTQSKRGGARPGSGRKRGNGVLERERRDWARKSFDDLAEQEVDAALIEAARDSAHPQFVAAARLLKEFKHGKPRQQIDATVSGVIASDDLSKLTAHERAAMIETYLARRSGAVPNDAAIAAQEKAASVGEAAG